jgi:hypothetical protein
MEDTNAGITGYLTGRFLFTEDQMRALSALDDFIRSKNGCFMLKGYAGTGKTFLTKGLVEYFGTLKWTVLLMAPTGRAARILSERTGQKATTIHKGIYNLNDISEVRTHSGKREKYKFRFGLNNELTTINTIILIDEASMVSDNEQESDFFIFGSGRLLSDLLSFTALNNESRNVKIIFIGDNAQLPPVGDRISGALTGEYILSTFSIPSSEYQLSEIVRQAGDSGVLTIARYLREKLAEKNRNSFRLPDTTQDVHHTDTGSAVGKFLNIYREKGPEAAIMIHYRNRDAHLCNMEIRDSLFPGCSELQTGDRLIITVNNYNYAVELLNGTFVTVKHVDPDRLVRSNIPSHKKDGTEIRVTLAYRKVSIEVPTDDGPFLLTCLILESFLEDPEASLSYEENIAAYIDFKIRHPDLKPGTSGFRDALRSDPYFNAVKVKYGYAITGHKSQGGEWHTAFVNMSIPQSILSDDFIRWSYTAVTRAAKTLWLFNVPSHTVYAKIRYEPVVIGSSVVGMGGNIPVSLRLTDEQRSFARTQGLETAPRFLLDHYHALLAALQDTGIRILTRTGHNYQEQYLFESEGRQVALVFSYNGSGKFTRTLPRQSGSTDPDLLKRLLKILSEPVAFTLEQQEVPASLDDASTVQDDADFSEDIPEITFEGTLQPHERLYRDLSLLLRERRIRITKAEHLPYKERYHFSRSDEKACVDFTYDSNNSYTWVKAVARHCNAPAMLEEIADGIVSLKNL